MWINCGVFSSNAEISQFFKNLHLENRKNELKTHLIFNHYILTAFNILWIVRAQGYMYVF